MLSSKLKDQFIFQKTYILALMRRRMVDKTDIQDEDEDDEKDPGEERPAFKSNFFVPAHPVLMIGKLGWIE